jgi:archaellum biogenesis protein FlaJ (TadC family)
MDYTLPYNKNTDSKMKNMSTLQDLYIALAISAFFIVINIILTLNGMSPFEYF